MSASHSRASGHHADEALLHRLGYAQVLYREMGGLSPLAFLLGGESPLLYRWPTVAICGAVAAAILWGLHGVRHSLTAEEQLEEARQRRDSPALGA